MSISALLGARLGLEELVDEVEEVEEGAALDGSETVEGEMLDVADTETEVEEVAEQAEDLGEAEADLQSIAILLAKAAKKGGMDDLGLEAVNINLRAIARRANVGNEISASLESISHGDNKTRTVATLENVKEMIKGWWASFKAAMAKIFTKIKDFFTSLFNSVPRIAKRAATILLEAGRVNTKTPANEKIKITGRDKLCIENKFAGGAGIAKGLDTINDLVGGSSLFEKVAGMDGVLRESVNEYMKTTPKSEEDHLKDLVEQAKDLVADFTKPYKGGKYKRATLGDYAIVAKDLPAEMKTPSDVVSAISFEYAKIVHGSPLESSGEEKTLSLTDIKDIADTVIKGCRELTNSKTYTAKVTAMQEKLPKDAEAYFAKVLADSKEDDAVKKIRTAQIKDSVKMSYRMMALGGRMFGAAYSHALRTNVAALNYAAKSLDQYKEGKKKEEDKKEDKKD